MALAPAGPGRPGHHARRPGSVLGASTSPPTPAPARRTSAGSPATTPPRRCGRCTCACCRPGASGCAGGVLTTSAVDGPSAAGLQIKVTAPGVATLVWFHQLNLTEARLAMATYANGVAVRACRPVAALRATAGCWTSRPPRTASCTPSPRTTPGSGQILHLQPLAPGALPTDVIAPWYVGKASLAFVGQQGGPPDRQVRLDRRPALLRLRCPVDRLRTGPEDLDPGRVQRPRHDQARTADDRLGGQRQLPPGRRQVDRERVQPSRS